MSELENLLPPSLDWSQTSRTPTSNRPSTLFSAFSALFAISA